MRAGRRSLAGKIAVVTGAAGGIGRALVRRLSRAGASVALLDLDVEGARAAAEDIAGEGGTAIALACDVTSEESCRDAIASVIEKLGGVDVLVNNAGITQLGTLAETDVSIYRRVIDVNLFGALHCTKSALASLTERRGVIVVISSVAGFAPLYGRSGYAASKHALHGLFETARCELRESGVGVLMVCPGFTATAIESHALGKRARTTVGRMASPDVVADAIVAAIEKGRRLIVLSAVGRLSRLLSRTSPALYERLMTRRMR